MTKSFNSAFDAIRNKSHPSVFGGAIIDAEGREIPITEEMILEACDRLEDAAKSAYPQSFKPQSADSETPQ